MSENWKAICDEYSAHNRELMKQLKEKNKIISEYERSLKIADKVMNDRLKKIDYEFNPKEHFEGFNLNPDDIQWLIEQAERFEKLSEIHYQTLIKNRRYKEALELIEEDIYDVHGITEILERTLEKDNKEE